MTTTAVAMALSPTSSGKQRRALAAISGARICRQRRLGRRLGGACRGGGGGRLSAERCSAPLPSPRDPPSSARGPKRTSVAGVHKSNAHELVILHENSFSAFMASSRSPLARRSFFAISRQTLCFCLGRLLSCHNARSPRSTDSLWVTLCARSQLREGSRKKPKCSDQGSRGEKKAVPAPG